MTQVWSYIERYLRARVERREKHLVSTAKAGSSGEQSWCSPGAMKWGDQQATQDPGPEPLHHSPSQCPLRSCLSCLGGESYNELGLRERTSSTGKSYLPIPSLSTRTNMPYLSPCPSVSPRRARKKGIQKLLGYLRAIPLEPCHILAIPSHSCLENLILIILLVGIH